MGRLPQFPCGSERTGDNVSGETGPGRWSGIGSSSEVYMSATACPACGAPLVEIAIEVGAGTRTLCSCSTCDQRWWQVDGRLTTLDGVIDDLGNPLSARSRS